MTVKYLVYGLVDPRTRLIRYVGKSSSGMNRPNRHRLLTRVTAGPYCTRWIRSLQTAGLDYEIVVLNYTDKESLSDLERFWIAYGRASGWPLTNATDGGDGQSPGYRPSPETIAKIAAANKGGKRSEASRQKMAENARAQMAKPEAREALRARVFTPEWRAKIGAKHRGKINSEEMIAKIRETKQRAGKLTLEKAQSIIAAVRAGESMNAIGLRYGITHSAVQKIRDGRLWKNAHDGAVVTKKVIGRTSATSRHYELLHGELYRCERTLYPEFVDLGGEA